MKVKFMSLSRNERGFAFIAALLAMLIMTSLGILIFSLTTRDTRVSIRVAGEKRAFQAAESGLQQLLIYTNANAGNVATYTLADTTVNSGFDTHAVYSVSNPPPADHPNPMVRADRSIPGNSDFKCMVTLKRVTGKDTNFSSQVQIDAGVCFPVPTEGGG